MRRVAHSMMPEALVRYGLPDAVRDFCEDLSPLKVHFQALGLDQRLESSTEVVLFRIVQELLNNVVKHAEATEVYVQIIRKNDVLSLTVEDNGKGFDTSNQATQQGSGMRNIANRVAYLNGSLNIQSKVHEGTSVFIEIPIA
jgi:signal transduction histidine kinase